MSGVREGPAQAGATAAKPRPTSELSLWLHGLPGLATSRVKQGPSDDCFMG